MNVAFIPVRGNSKSIPLKNIREFNGKPLVYWTIKAACESQNIDIVYVATENNRIKEVVASFLKTITNGDKKVVIIGRSEESATDNASTEFAMLEFADKYEFDNIVLIQATSPLLKSEDIDGGFKLFNLEETDSVLSVVRQKRFVWEKTDNGNVQASNYDIYNRPRRQDFEGFLMENGAFYITSKSNLIKSKNRLSGNIKAYVMSEETAYEIDEERDWIILEQLAKSMFE